jgi:O-methyltransferase involved in polyketide biosynthesis
MVVTGRGLTPVQRTALLTAHGRALDNESARPILADALSSEVADKVDAVREVKVLTASRLQIAVRAKGLDRSVRRQLAEHPASVALDLGAGLDTRVFRVDPDPSVDWHDVDYPELMDIRRQVLPDRPHAHLVGASLTEQHWLDRIPGNRHAVIVAEAVFPFLSQEEIESLVGRLIDHFPSGDLIFNGYPGMAQWVAKLVPSSLKGIVEIERSKTFTDPRVPERWHPRLKLAEEVLLARDPESAQDIDRFPFLMRIMSRPAALTPGLARIGARVLRYSF